jgi:hypothetical protein
VSAVYNNLQNKYSDIASRTVVKVDDDLLNAMAGAEKEIMKRIGPEKGQAVLSYIDDIMNSGGKIAGDVYQNARSQLGLLARNNTDSIVATQAKSLQKALDAAAEKSLNVADKGAWRLANKQYQAYKGIEKAMSSSGAEALKGNISPAALLNAVKSGNKAYSRGAGELNELARAGAMYLREPIGNSGTAQRQFWQNLLSTGGGAAAAGAGAVSIPAAIAAVAAPKIAQTAYYSAPVKALLSGSANARLTAEAAKIASQKLGAATADVEKKQQNTQQPITDPELLKLLDAEDLPQVDLPQVNNMERAPTRIDITRPEAIQTPEGVVPNQAGRGGGTNSLAMDAGVRALTNPNDDFLNKMQRAESGNNPNAKNPNSTASGAFQFIDSTWKDMVRKYGAKYGVRMQDKGDAEAQRKMAYAFAQENGSKLKKVLGREPNAGELYVAHFAGGGGASRLYRARDTGAPAARLLPEAAKSNRSIFYDGKRPRTVDEVLTLLESKVA